MILGYVDGIQNNYPAQHIFFLLLLTKVNINFFRQTSHLPRQVWLISLGQICFCDEYNQNFEVLLHTNILFNFKYINLLKSKTSTSK